MKKVISVTLAILMLLACALPVMAEEMPLLSTVDPELLIDIAPDIAASSNRAIDALAEGQEKVASVGKLELYANLKTGEFSVLDVESDYLWTHGIDQTKYDVSIGGTWGKRSKAIIEVRHFDKKTKEATTKSVFAPGDNDSAKVKKIQNGISCTYEFKSAKISVTVEITIDQNGLSISVPADKLEEGESRGIVAIAVLPGFGAGGQGEEGYIVYPDGCGGLTDFTKRYERTKSVSEEVWYIYGTDTVSIDDYVKAVKKHANVASLPMYGIVKGNNGLLAYISEGDADAMMRLQVAGYPATMDLYRSYFEFSYRHVYSQYMSNITINGKSQADNATAQRIDLAMNKEDICVNYALLSGEEANYSGIANAYRKVLLEKKVLTDKISAGDKVPMGIDFFVGIMEDMGIYEKQTVVTSFANCITILQALQEAGVDDIETILKGWEKDGYGSLPNVAINSAAGGKKGLQSLANFAKENNITVALFTNFMFGYSQNNGFSLKNDIVYNGAGVPISSKTYKTTYILTPAYVAENHARMLNNIASADGVGVAYNNIAKYLYMDYNPTHKTSRSDTKATFEKLFADTKAQNRTVAVEYGNLYSLTDADRIFEMPITSTRKYTCDKDVPLVQLVLHGIMPYSAESMNLSSDLVKTKLQWVEYGCMPQFELTYKSSVELKQTSYNKLFSSQYEKWLDDVQKLYSEFNQNLACVWGETMKEHTVLAEDVVRVAYANGIRIYINYTHEAVTADGVTIPATDYMVVK